jgi:DNA-directed RNA polymerase specialized sigma24 family protein
LPATGCPELDNLLHARNPRGQEEAWTVFCETYESTILHALRRLEDGARETKDRYASVLEQLASENFRRLREYPSQSRSGFATWLCVVVRRIVMEAEDRRNGQGTTLVDLLAEHLGVPDREVLDAAFRDLPSRDRLLLKLRFEFGLSARRISTVMSFPTPAHVRGRCDALCEALSPESHG